MVKSITHSMPGCVITANWVKCPLSRFFGKTRGVILPCFKISPPPQKKKPFFIVSPEKFFAEGHCTQLAVITNEAYDHTQILAFFEGRRHAKSLELKRRYHEAFIAFLNSMNINHETCLPVRFSHLFCSFVTSADLPPRHGRGIRADKHFFVNHKT